MNRDDVYVEESTNSSTTGLSGRFDIDLAWDQPDFQQKTPAALKQALVDELGLELMPAMESIDMLIVQQSR
jgi:uncharacterized protein (TIGR03435 family)